MHQGRPTARAGALALLLMSCQAGGQPGGQNGGQNVQPLGPEELRVTGTVHKTPVGINCWRFVATDGTGYELRPEQVPAGILEDGRGLTLVLRPRADLMSTCQVGQIVDVVRAEG